MPKRFIKTTSKELPEELRNIVTKGDKIRVYLGEDANARTTSYTMGICTGQFTEDGLPIIKQEAPKDIVYDFYLNEFRVKFTQEINKKRS